VQTSTSSFITNKSSWKSSLSLLKKLKIALYF